jgi:hypothetical protein
MEVRFILRKYVDADDAREALALDEKTPVHDVYLKDGEEPKRDNAVKDCIGFVQKADEYWRPDEVRAKK